MNLATLNQGGTKIAVNIDQVEWLEPYQDVATRIHFASGTAILVDERIGDVVKAFAQAARGN